MDCDVVNVISEEMLRLKRIKQNINHVKNINRRISIYRHVHRLENMLSRTNEQLQSLRSILL